MTLTLAGLRLWILIRAFLSWSLKWFTRLSHRQDRHFSPSSSSAHPPHYGEIPLHDFLAHNLHLSQHSHSELSAARDILRNAWEEIRMNNIRLPSPESRWSRLEHLPFTHLSVPIAFKRLVGISADTLVSLTLAFLLVAIFVAESTGAVLSANIFGDNHAISVSPNCTSLASMSPVTNQDVSDYQRLCYDASSMDTRCNIYVNRTILYTEHSNTSCPFIDGVCLQPAYTLDTGYDRSQHGTGLFCAEKNIVCSHTAY